MSKWNRLLPFIYIKCVSTFRCNGWTYQCILTYRSHECELSWLNLSNNWVQTMLLQWHGYGQEEPSQSDLDFHLLYMFSIQTPTDAVDGPPYFKAWRWAELADSQFKITPPGRQYGGALRTGETPRLRAGLTSLCRRVVSYVPGFVGIARLKPWVSTAKGAKGTHLWCHWK